MKTFLLIITILLLMNRISSTPRNLSKKSYKKYIEKETKSVANFISKKNENELNAFKTITFLLVLVITVFVFWYYLHIGSRFSNKILYFMSVIQASTTLVFSCNINRKILPSTNPEDYKFNRWYALFNVVLDYVYYPMVICALLG